MTTTKTATGFVAQDVLMSYATPAIQHLARGVDTWQAAASWPRLDWEPETRPVWDRRFDGQEVPGVRAIWHGDGPAGHRHRPAPPDQPRRAGQGGHRGDRRPPAPISALVVLDGGRRIGARVTHG